MGKLKTKKGAKKRFKITKSGKIKRAKGGKSHILTSKREARKRRLKKAGLVSKAQSSMIKALLPYGR